VPTYVYECKNCEHQFETFQKMTDQPLTECPKCKGKIARVLFPPGIVFKGSGFHINDYPSKSAASGGSAKPVTESEPKIEPQTETKTDTKVETEAAKS
jgi:putative FmdB family regulatory protein